MVKDPDRYADFVKNYCLPYAEEFAEEIRENDPDSNISLFRDLLENCFGTLDLFFGYNYVSNGSVVVEFLGKRVSVSGPKDSFCVSYGDVKDNLVLLGRVLEALGLLDVSLEFTGAEAQDVRQSDPDVEEDVEISFKSNL